MNIEVGREYVRRNGEVVRIVSSNNSIYADKRVVFIDQNCNSYHEDGSYWADNYFPCDFDLIEAA